MTDKSQELRRKGRKRSVVAAAAAVAAPTFKLGEPERPKGLEYAQRRAWNALVASLMGRRVLAETDGSLLLEIIALRARIAGKLNADAAKTRLAEIEAEFDTRRPFAKPKAVKPDQSVITLDDFRQAVGKERGSFESRILPGSSLTLDAEGRAYAWDEGDATSVAHRYAQDIFAGAIVAGELTKRMAARHLDDMQHAHERGYVWDVVAARNIITWFEKFCGLPMSKSPWEVFVVASIMAWKDAAGFRRFKEAWLSVARKNGKTAIAAAFGLYGLVIGDCDKHQEVFFAAVKKDQAKIAWKDSARMVSEHPDLSAYVKKYVNSLVVESTDSFAQPMSSDVRSADGTRPSFVIADELHEWNRDLYDKLTSGMVLRKNRLLIGCTTAGDNLTSFCAGKEDFLEKVLQNITPDDTKFVAIYRMEKEWKYSDASKWLASNPNLGVTLAEDALRNQLTEIENDPSALNGFLRFHCNQWVTLRAGHTFSMDKIDACRGAAFEGMDCLQMREWALRTLAGKRCFGGFDYGESDDMCSAVLLFPDVILPGEKRAKHVVLPWYWIPTEGLQQKEKLWRVPLSSWSRDGLVRLVEGDITDPMTISPQIAGISAAFDVKDWRFDRLGGTVSMFAELEKEHKIRKATQFAFTIVQTTQPAKAMKMGILKGEIALLDNPVLKWNFGNVEMNTEMNGCMTTKKANGDRSKKIDGVDALLDAWHSMIDPENKTVTPKVFSL
jgi:phage terminase large subunit-like protein